MAFKKTTLHQFLFYLMRWLLDATYTTWGKIGRAHFKKGEMDLKNMPPRRLEIAFQRIQNSKFFWGGPPDPPSWLRVLWSSLPISLAKHWQLRPPPFSKSWIRPCTKRLDKWYNRWKHSQRKGQDQAQTLVDTILEVSSILKQFPEMKTYWDHPWKIVRATTGPRLSTTMRVCKILPVDYNISAVYRENATI